MLGLINALKYIIGVKPHSSCFEACACSVQRFHLQEVCTRDRFCILPRMMKYMALFHIKKFSCHFTLLLNFNVWVICGSHPDCSVGLIGATHFQPCTVTVYIVHQCTSCTSVPIVPVYTQCTKCTSVLNI